MEEFGKLRMTLLHSNGSVIDRFDIPQDDLFEETLRAFAEEVADVQASQVMMVRLDYIGHARGFETVEVDEFFWRFIERLIEENEEDQGDDSLIKEVENYGV